MMTDEISSSLPERDVEALLNVRDCPERALRGAGAEVTDSGMGMGQADLGVLLDGLGYSVSIKPRVS